MCRQPDEVVDPSKLKVGQICIMERPASATAAPPSKRARRGDARRDLTVEARSTAAPGGLYTCSVTSVPKAVPDGTYPPARNQDAALAYTLPGRVSVAGVLDGHGPKGHRVSAMMRHWLRQCVRVKPLEAGQSLYDIVHAAMENAIEKVLQPEEKGGAPTSEAGTTAVFGVRRGSEICVANVGDSSSFVCRIDGLPRPGQMPPRHRFAQIKPGAVHVQPLSKEHTLHDQRERERVRAAGGVVIRRGSALRVQCSDNVGHALALSRSVGDDWARPAGVIPDADITTHSLDPVRDAFAIFATDGLMDVMAPLEVAQYVVREVERCDGDWTATLHHLCVEARTRYLRNTGQVRADDVTVALMLLQQSLE